MNQEDFEAQFLRAEPEVTGQRCSPSKFSQCIRSFSPLNFVYSFIPILHWLPKYRWKEDLHGDIIGGLTVGIMHVPQGMAYASLASLPPVYGLYSSFFASSIYAFFGTSRHISIGVFAVASMMVGAVRLRLVPNAFPPLSNVNLTGTTDESPYNTMLDPSITPIMLTSTLTLAVGVVQLVMAVLHLGFLTTYLSDSLVSGFTTGAACHVFTAQLNKVLAVKLPRYGGTGMLFFMLRDLFLSIPKANFFTVSLSVFGLIFLKIGKDYVNPMVKKRCPVPVPVELILVIITTAFSSAFSFKKNFQVPVVDHVPQGVPYPSFPRVDLFPMLLADAVGIALVCFMFVISMAKLFAKKRKYSIDAGQELYAVSFMSIFSSFFPVYPTGASLSRSSVCEQSGANTQLYTLFSSSLLLTVIIWLGPLLEPLPMCILACIVMISLESLFLQCRELPLLWKISKFDFMVWVVSCVATMSNSVMTGLIVSVTFNILSLTLREQWPKLRSLGHLSVKGIYKPEEDYVCLPNQNENLRILRFEAPLHFANVNVFKEKVNAVITQLQDETRQLKEVPSNTTSETDNTSQSENVLEFQNKESSVSEHPDVEKSLTLEKIGTAKIIILDCSAIPYLDNMGIDTLKEVYLDASKVGISVLIVDVSETIMRVFRNIDFFSIVPKTSFFPTVHQAVIHSTIN